MLAEGRVMDRATGAVRWGLLKDLAKRWWLWTRVGVTDMGRGSVLTYPEGSTFR